MLFCFPRLLQPMQTRAHRLTPRLQEQDRLPGSLELEFRTWKLIACSNKGKQLSWYGTGQCKKRCAQAGRAVTCLENSIPPQIGPLAPAARQAEPIAATGSTTRVSDKVHPSLGRGWEGPTQRPNLC